MKFKFLILTFLFILFSFQIVNANPLTNQYKPKDQKQVEQSEPNIFTKTWFRFMQVQKTLNKKITHCIREIKDGSTTAFWIVLAISFLYGIIHAIGPGHGKLLVLSYFTSHEAQWWRGVLMGFQIAFMHVVSAIALVLLTNGIARHALGATPSKEIQIIKLISYAAITIVGFVMLYQLYDEKKKKSLEVEHNKAGQKVKSQWILALSIGLVPCTGALLFLFYAMSKQMLLTGISIVFAMALGIAVTLSVIGVACILTRQNISHLKNQKKESTHITTLRYVGAGLIIFIGSSLFLSTVL